MTSTEKPDFDEILTDVNATTGGTYSCPVCHDYEADSIRSVKGHISGSRDETHADLGWNYEDEIEATADRS